MAGSRSSWATRRFESLSQNERKTTKKEGPKCREAVGGTARGDGLEPHDSSHFLHGQNDTLRTPDLQCTQEKEDTCLQEICELLTQLQLS